MTFLLSVVYVFKIDIVSQSNGLFFCHILVCAWLRYENVAQSNW